MMSNSLDVTSLNAAYLIYVTNMISCLRNQSKGKLSSYNLATWIMLISEHSKKYCYLK